MIAIFRYALCAFLFGFGLSHTVAYAAWYEASSERFVIYADDEEAEIRRYAENLERFHGALENATGRELAAPSPSNRIKVFVVGSAKRVERLAGKRGVAGFYLPRAGDGAAFVQTIKNQNGRPHLSTVILQHEYTHHFLFSTTRFAMPLWMSEGAAEYFGMTGFRENGDAVLGLRATHRWRDLHMRNSASIEVAPLLDFDPDKPFGSLDPDAFYSRAWLLYHYLSSSEEREGQLRAYWLDILRGVAPMDAANAAFGGVNQLERELSLHWRRPKNPFIEVAADQIRIGDIAVRALSPGETAMMKFRISSSRGVSAEYAAKLVKEARKVAASHKDDPFVLSSLAKTEFDAGNDEAAASAARAALAIDGSNASALMTLGKSLFRVAAQKSGQADYAEAMEPFEKLAELEPDNPLPLIYRFRAYVARGVEPSAAAKADLLRAGELAPYDANLWLVIGLLHIHEGQIADARAALTPLAGNPHGGSKSAQMRDLLTMLQGRNEGEAFPMLGFLAQQME